MKNLSIKTLRAALVALSCILAFSCTKDDKEEPHASTGAYILNNGAWNANNAGISRYDFATKTLTGDAFATANGGTALGDLGQDILAVGDELYIAVNGSQTIFVTDRDLVLKKAVTASAGDAKLSPRSLCYGGGKVYVTYYEGYLGEIDPKTYTVRTTAVGPNPEGVAYVGGKVYTSNSGGSLYGVYNNTVSVVDAASFKETSTYTVNVNPQALAACGQKLYLNSYGDYGAAAPKVQCIDIATGTVADLDYDSPSAIAVQGDVLYILCGGYDADWNPLPGTVYRYDAAKGAKLGTFVTDGTTLPQAYSLSATEHYVWVGCSDYKNTGDVYAFDIKTGRLFDSFDSEGINPLKVIE
ncbi:MAG: YncE family protein [Bacteroidales bacterium]|nr:YncE family protein [Bacteroidales bacterium]